MTFIVSAVRTPIGSFQGSLSPFRSPELGGIVIKEAVSRAKVKPEQVENVVFGCVLPAGLGQNPARQAAMNGGLPNSTGAFTINKVCSSGLLAVALADQAIRAGDGVIYVAGGMESMTNSPYMLPKARGGYRMGDGKIVDTLVNDGLWDIYNDKHMGALAEQLAAKNKIGRKEQDDYAIQSYKRAIEATEKGRFKNEIVAVPVPQKKGDPVMFDKDEELGKINYDKLVQLKPSFDKNGTVTAANSSSVSDGAAALVVMCEKKTAELGLKPLARIVAFVTHSHEPEWFTTAPIMASKKVLAKAGLTIKDIDLMEANEAFSVQVIALIKELGIDPNKVNVNGGAVAIGHPIGCSGARILTTLTHALHERGGRYGLATLCNGGGEATAMVIERV